MYLSVFKKETERLRLRDEKKRKMDLQDVHRIPFTQF